MDHRHIGTHVLSWPWPTMWEVVTNWPWSTIAAFAAAGGALYIARSETNERHVALGRQAIVDVNAAALTWNAEAGTFMSAVRRFLGGHIKANDLNQALGRLTTAAAATARVLTATRLACNDFEIQVRVAQAELQIIAFMQPLANVQAGEATTEEQRHRLEGLFSSGQVTMREFGAAADALVVRGFEIYSPRRGWRYRWANRKWDKRVKSERRQRDLSAESDKTQE